MFDPAEAPSWPLGRAPGPLSRRLNMCKIAFLGLGAMGSRMAMNLLKAGNELTVWNLTPGPAKSLAASGAKLASTPREAAEGNEFVMTMVTNDDASRQVWLDAANGALL